MQSSVELPGDEVSVTADEAPKASLRIALALLVVSAATILAALGFQYIGRYQPCALCLMQRTPYYVGVPIAALAVLAGFRRAARVVLIVLFVAFAAVMTYGAGLGVYHAGVEWGIWMGPATCAPTGGVSDVGDMLDQLEHDIAPSCTEATWRFLGLSFAGWNAVISILLVGLGILGVASARPRVASQTRRT
jgi:disulfide bond formation protein DsbB